MYTRAGLSSLLKGQGLLQHHPTKKVHLILHFFCTSGLIVSKIG